MAATSAEENETAGPQAKSLIYPSIVVAFLMVLYTSSFIDRTILGLMVKPIRADLHITDTEYSLLAGFAFVLMYTFSGIPLGWVIDRWSRRGVIAIGVTVWSIMTAACGLAGSFWRLFAARVGVGIGEATLSPASYSLVSDLFPPSKLARALSVYGLGIPIGSGLALVIGGAVIEAITAIGPVDFPLIGVTKPWQTVFFIIGLPGLLLALLTLLIIREPRRHNVVTAQDEKPNFKAAIVHMWRHRDVYAVLSLSMGVGAMYSYGANAWFPSFLQRVHGFTAAEAGIFLGTSTLVLGIFGSVAAGWQADRLIARGHIDGHLRVGMRYTVGMFLCGALGPIVPIPWLSLALISASSFFSFTWVGTNVSLLQIVTPSRMRGQVSAIYLFITNMVGLGLGPTAIAASTDYLFKSDTAIGWSLALVGTVSLAVTAVIIWVGGRPIRRKLESQGFGRRPIEEPTPILEPL